jgi:hypothetical protein
VTERSQIVKRISFLAVWPLKVKDFDVLAVIADRRW